MTNEEVQKVAECLRRGTRVAAVGAIRKARGNSLMMAKGEMEEYLPTVEDSKSPEICASAAIRYLKDNLVGLGPTFEEWFEMGVRGGFFKLIEQVKGV